MLARAWLDGRPSEGGPVDVDLPVVELRSRALVLPGLVVLDERPGPLFRGEDDLRPDPSLGHQGRRAARAFGLVNTAHHVGRGLERVASLLGRPLPPLTVRVGCHAEERPRWAGGHYRLPAHRYADLAEAEAPLPTGEVHLGAGGRLRPIDGMRYRAAPAHNVAIALHELGHHLCRHTADFRANERRPPGRQSNRKVALDEGTSDYLAAVLLGTPDIYGWHRGGIPSSQPARRRLDGRLTMADFSGGRGADPHADGSIWAGALWALRSTAARRGTDPSAVDRVVLHGLERVGSSGSDEPPAELCRRRRRFAVALEALLEVADGRGGGLADLAERTFAARGIRVGKGNASLRRTASGRASSPTGDG